MGIFSLIRIGNFETGTKPDFPFYARAQFVAERKRVHNSGKPVDKMSAVWKYF